MIKGLIFDLDQTIIDSSIAEAYRKQRNWQGVYTLIPSFTLYNGFLDVFSYNQKSRIRLCIVTTSPSIYAKKVISHFKIPCEFIIDYFFTTFKKPHPVPMLKALELFNLTNKEVISFGDRHIDIKSSNLAGIKSVACLWGTNEKEELLNAKPNFIISHPIDIIKLIEKY